MNKIKNLELLNNIESLEGSTTLFFKDVDNVEYSINIRDIKINNNNISPITILCKMYNVNSIDEITFVRGNIIDNTLINIGHIIRDEWLISIIQAMNKYNDYFKYAYESSNENNNSDCVKDNASQTKSSYESYTIITPFKRNTYYIYADKLVLRIDRQKSKQGQSKTVYIEMDPCLLDMMQTVEWRFAFDSSSTKLYFVNGYYKNQTNPGKYGGKTQINMSDYCYGCKPGLIKFELINDNYFKVNTTMKPFNKMKFEENLKKYSK